MNKTQHNAPQRPSVAHEARIAPKGALPEKGSGGPLVSRRRFLYGALGVGAVAAVGVGVGVASQSASEGGGAVDIDYLDVPKSALTTLSDLEVLDSPEGSIQLVAQHDLPFGSLVWVNDDDVAACLLPTETGSPLAQVGILFLGSGDVTTVLERSTDAENGFEIYDARATGSGVIWTEANIMQGIWRVYAAPLEAGALGEAVLLEEGDSTFDTPTLAVSGKRAFWQVLPKKDYVADNASRLMGATFGKNDAEVVFESSRRMGTPPYSGVDSITIAPRVDTSTVYYELTNIDAASGKVLDSLVLPRLVTPLEAGYGANGFMFSFPDIYNLEGAIANLGTYVARTKPANGDYNNAQWFDFARTPTAAPAWCGDYFIVKSSYSVCGVDLKKGSYFAIDVDDGADSYGEYLATTGARDTFVTYTNVDHKPIEGERIHACRVKVWAPV